MSNALERKAVGQFIPSPGDRQIYVWSWHPVGIARGVVVIVPGFNAHGGRYEWVAKTLNLTGIAVYAVDLRGRGKSSGERFYIDSFSDYVDDVSAAVALARSSEPDVPVFLMGHSAGGVVACLFALAHQDELAGLICESFSLEVPAPDFALAALKGLSFVLPHAHVVRLKNADFSRDPEVVRVMNDDPMTKGEVQPTKTIAEMTRAGERVRGAFAEVTLPILILHGSIDKVAKPSGSQHFFDGAGSADKTLKIYEGHFHDLLSDTGRDLVIGDINHWIHDRLRHSQRASE